MMEFQSLFLWRENATLILEDQEDLPSSCFNPCFYGGRMQLFRGDKDGVFIFKFQSLFLWRENATLNLSLLCQFLYQFVSILVFMEGECNNTWERYYDGYKEVSILVFMEGECNTKKMRQKMVTLHVRFNPCFYGGRMQQRRGSQHNIFVGFKFQSLFLWRENATYWNSIHISMIQQCFNPCFYGGRMQRKCQKK